jgi:hypothetical protein
MCAKYTKRGQRIVSTLFAFTIVNAGAFVAGLFILGGSALIGHVEGDHYFVNDHGRIAEVSGPQWVYSYAHTCLFFGNVLGAFPIWLWLVWSGDMDI